jgi:hypothetical protein
MSSHDSQVQSTSSEFLDAARDANWKLAVSILESHDDPSEIVCPSASPVAWFIRLNAPPDVVVQCLRHYLRGEATEADRLGLLELCISLVSSNSNALPTFRALLTSGLSPNTWIEGGNTLLQHAVELNRTSEVAELLRHGVDPHQMSIFGIESTSNLEGARQAGNAAGALVLAKFGSKGVA